MSGIKVKNRFVLRLAGSLASQAIIPWMNSLDTQVACYDDHCNPAWPSDGKRRIFVFWHEYLLLLIHLWKHCNISMLLSRHPDADVLEQLAMLFGFGTVRGSTNRHGVEALRKMITAGSRSHLTITPDGPRGPRRRLAPGCVYLASRLRMPLVLVGVGFDRPWRTPTWDRFALPRIGSRARIVASGDIEVPAQLDRDGLEHYRVKIENLLNYLTEEAENWATSGERIEGQSGILAGPKRSILCYDWPKTAQVETIKE